MGISTDSEITQESSLCQGETCCPQATSSWPILLETDILLADDLLPLYGVVAACIFVADDPSAKRTTLLG